MFLFKSKAFDPIQFETQLKSITSKISKNEKQLRKLKTQQKHYQRTIPLYLTSIYIAYFSYLYIYGKITDGYNLEYLIILPSIICLIYYVLVSGFGYLIKKKISTIEYWKSEHEEKVGVLKEKTSFDKTRELLARFSNGEDLEEMEKEASAINEKRQEYIRLIQSGEKGKILADLQKNNNSTLYDHFLTKLLGENELGPDNRYALICTECFKHNGLAPPGKLATEVQYKCPECGFMNGKPTIAESSDFNEAN